MLQQVQRVTLTGSVFEKVEFDKAGSKYMVKNFTDDDIYVSFDSTATTDNSVKIPAGFYQVVIANEYDSLINDYKNSTDSVYIKGTGEVEVQQLWFR